MRIWIAVAFVLHAVAWFLPVLVDFPIPSGEPGGIFGTGERSPSPSWSQFQAALNAVHTAISGEGRIRGYNAARFVFDSLKESLRQKGVRLGDRVRLVWINVANPLFLLGLVAALFRWRSFAVGASILGGASALYWITSADLGAGNLGPGYWLWLSSFAVAVVAGFSAGPPAK